MTEKKKGFQRVQILKTRFIGITILNLHTLNGGGKH